MEITILGWYGTETLGDRAILAGIIKFLTTSLRNPKIHLGSLYPFFSKRTVDEDQDFWRETTGVDTRLNLFDSKEIGQMDKAISQSQIIFMGGGPLMHIEQLYMVRYAFRVAKKQDKKTAILGCGIGPLASDSYQSCLLDIAESSDLIILRDSSSKKQLLLVAKKFEREINKNIETSFDPSVQSCLDFKRESQTQDYIAINLRKFPVKYSDKGVAQKADEALLEFVKQIRDQFWQKEIRLIPMHYFHFGNDDRIFLRTLAEGLGNKNIFVQEKPLSLIQTLKRFQEASLCFGMRYHSVIFQTLLNGNNYVLDYSQPKVGKISSFLRDIDAKGFYRNRYINLQEKTVLPFFKSYNNKKFKLPRKKIERALEVYPRLITKLIA